MSDYEQFKDLLISYVNEQFPKKEKEKVTFFDVTGYPHYENVASNVLKFFFDTNEEHGFGDLWLRSLLEAYNKKASVAVLANSPEVLNIEREYSNGSDKRIDLLIDARPLIIVIENKIYASVYNPFDVYTQMADNYVKDNQIGDSEMVKIVLSLSEENIDPANGFINVTYDELFENVKKHWWDYNPNEKWGMFAKDFIANLQRREGETHMKLDEKWIHFVNENGETLKGLFDRIQNDLDTRISILRKLDEELSDIKKFKKGVWNSKSSSYVSQFIIMSIHDGATICFETYLMKSPSKKDAEDYDKLYIALWCRGNKHYNFDEVLKAIGKERARERNGAWGKHYILDAIDLCKEFSIPEIASTIRKYVNDGSQLCL